MKKEQSKLLYVDCFHKCEDLKRKNKFCIKLPRVTRKECE